MEFSIIFFEPFPNSIINNFYPLLWTGVIPFGIVRTWPTYSNKEMINS